MSAFEPHDPIPALDTLPADLWADIAGQTLGLFSDIDDTLTEHGHLVPAAYAALVRARAAGLRLVLVTGRPLGWAEVLANIFPIDAAVAENGAVAALPGGRRVYFEDEETRAQGATRRAAARDEVARALPEVRPAGDQALREVDLAFDIAETVRLPEDRIAELAAILGRHGLNTTRSSIHMHGSFSRGDKASMAARIAELLWAEPAEAVAKRYLFVGDSPNDAPAFRFFARSIGVANVLAFTDELTARGARPWAVTRGRAGHGFAELVDHLLHHRREAGTSSLLHQKT